MTFSPLGPVPDPEVPTRARRRTYGPHYKARILAQYDALDPAGRAALLRREGLYSSHISNWRKLRDQGALAALATTPGRPTAHPLEKEVARLQRENQRLQAELTTAQRVIDVQGKLACRLAAAPHGMKMERPRAAEARRTLVPRTRREN